MSQPATLDVVCIGNAIVDLIDDADDAFLARHGMVKGSMALIDEGQAERLYADMGTALAISGGSAGNTAAGLASLGAACGYIGKVKDDQLGGIYRHDMVSGGIKFPTPAAKDGPATARSLILVTADAQRTMNTYLGACVNLGPEDLDEDLISSAKVTYLEGYLFDPPHAKAAFRRAAAVAHAAGRKVALSLSDSFCVGRHREDFLDLIQNDVEYLFANEAEITALFQTEEFDVAIDEAAKVVDVLAVTRGAAGSVLVRGAERVTVAAAPIDELVDTTGAGDLYASGVLYGLTRNLPLAECGRLGSLAAAEIISHYGPRPQVSLKDYAGL